MFFNNKCYNLRVIKLAANSLVGVDNVVLFLGIEGVNRRINVACYF